MVGTPTRPLLELVSNKYYVWFKVYVDLLRTLQISDFATSPIWNLSYFQKIWYLLQLKSLLVCKRDKCLRITAIMLGCVRIQLKLMGFWYCWLTTIKCIAINPVESNLHNVFVPVHGNIKQPAQEIIEIWLFRKCVHGE